MLLRCYDCTAGLVDARETTEVTVRANAWDGRTSGYGCSPNGCIPQLTRDGSTRGESRWSCKEGLLGGKNCVITFEFEEPQDIVDMRISFYKGDERTRKLKIRLNGRVAKTIESSGETTGFETFPLNTEETATLSLEGLGLSRDEWISLTEVCSTDGRVSNGFRGRRQILLRKPSPLFASRHTARSACRFARTSISYREPLVRISPGIIVEIPRCTGNHSTRTLPIPHCGPP